MNIAVCILQLLIGAFFTRQRKLAKAAALKVISLCGFLWSHRFQNPEELYGYFR
jgi:hypothetical protein